VRLLLDTHTLLWAALSRRNLSPAAAIAIADETNEILVSAASAWEIAIKVRRGKLPEATTFEARFLEAINEAGYTLLSIDAATALRAARFAGEHRDPFDRILAAQALALDIPILSLDAKLDQFGVRRIW
jgi:PIN domain nuclease of toxin-antitoxin system